MPQQTLLANEFSKNNPLRASICDLVTTLSPGHPEKNDAETLFQMKSQT